MAKVYNSFLGPFSGKIGNIIGCRGRNGFYIRSVSIKTRKAPTELQLAQQTKFALCSTKLMGFKEVLKIGFSPAGYNAAFKSCLAEAITGEYPNYDIDYSKMRMSRGNLMPLQLASEFVGENILLTWPNQSNCFISFLNDRVYVIVYNQTRDVCTLFDKARRRDEQFSFSVERDPEDIYHLWVFCARYDGKVMSNSEYINLKL